MRFSVASDDMRAVVDQLEGGIAKAATAAMRVAARETVGELRDQVRSGGLGNRLANTWRDRVYPLKRQSLTPAGYIWSNAPDIVDAFVRGATIIPRGGRRYLAIPTANVPRAAGRRGSTKRMTPEQVEIVFNQDLFFKRGKAGRLLAFVNVVGARNGRGFRQRTARRAAQGRESKPVLMFVMVPAVRLPKLLDLDGPAQRGAARFEGALQEELGLL